MPIAGSVAQLGVPWLLRRANGDLRRVTLGILAVGELRGFWLAAITILSANGTIPNQVAIVLIAAIMGLAGAAGTIGGTNMQAWYGAVLPENDRRFVAPKVVATNLGLGSILLLPIALLIQWAFPEFGTVVYAWVFVAAGIAGIAELSAVTRLRRPGRVVVHEESEPGDAGRPGRRAARVAHRALLGVTAALPPHHHDRGVRGRLRTLLLDLRDQHPAHAGVVRDPAVGALLGVRARSRRPSSAGGSTADRPRACCASRSCSGEGPSSWACSRSRSTRSRR